MDKGGRMAGQGARAGVPGTLVCLERANPLHRNQEMLALRQTGKGMNLQVGDYVRAVGWPSSCGVIVRTDNPLAMLLVRWLRPKGSNLPLNTLWQRTESLEKMEETDLVFIRLKGELEL